MAWYNRYNLFQPKPPKETARDWLTNFCVGKVDLRHFVLEHDKLCADKIMNKPATSEFKKSVEQAILVYTSETPVSKADASMLLQPSISQPPAERMAARIARANAVYDAVAADSRQNVGLYKRDSGLSASSESTSELTSDSSYQSPVHK